MLHSMTLIKGGIARFNSGLLVSEVILWKTVRYIFERADFKYKLTLSFVSFLQLSTGKPKMSTFKHITNGFTVLHVRKAILEIAHFHGLMCALSTKQVFILDSL